MTWIQTYSGLRFDLLEPRGCSIDIEDIATALSNLCRFTGHVRAFYSVAQHSVLVSELVPRKYALAGLLHDATEAYVGDVSTPLKSLLPDYRHIEAGVWRAIAARFFLPERLPPCVKQADLDALVTERRDLLQPSPLPWATAVESAIPNPRRIHPQSPCEARAAFMDRYIALTEPSHHHEGQTA